MSIFNMTNKTDSKIKNVSLTLILIGSLLGATMSANANAASDKSIEDSLSEFVVAQGQSMIAELNTQLKLSIDKEIKALSTNFTLAQASNWLTTEAKVETPTSTINIANQINNTVNNEEVTHSKSN